MLGLQATPERLCLAMMVNHGESRMWIPCRDKGQEWVWCEQHRPPAPSIRPVTVHLSNVPRFVPNEYIQAVGYFERRWSQPPAWNWGCSWDTMEQQLRAVPPEPTTGGLVALRMYEFVGDWAAMGSVLQQFTARVHEQSQLHLMVQLLETAPVAADTMTACQRFIMQRIDLRSWPVAIVACDNILLYVNVHTRDLDETRFQDAMQCLNKAVRDWNDPVLVPVVQIVFERLKHVRWMLKSDAAILQHCCIHVVLPQRTWKKRKDWFVRLAEWFRMRTPHDGAVRSTTYPHRSFTNLLTGFHSYCSIGRRPNSKSWEFGLDKKRSTVKVWGSGLIQLFSRVSLV
jgi:hypothetical protein